MLRNPMACAIVAAALLAPGGATRAALLDREALAKATQTPIADITVLGFQDDLRPSLSPGGRLQNVLAFQPVIPFQLGPAVLVTRTVFPLVWQPVASGTAFGLGNVELTALIGPSKADGAVWAIGAVGLFPTATSSDVGSTTTWGVGPSFVFFSQPGAWLFGVLANNLWSVSGARMNALSLQPFASYNLPGGFFLTSSPTITSDWNATSGNHWRVPIGGGVGTLQVIGGVGVHLSAQAFWNAVRPSDQAAYPSAPWEARLTLSFVSP